MHILLVNVSDASTKRCSTLGKDNRFSWQLSNKLNSIVNQLNTCDKANTSQAAVIC